MKNILKTFIAIFTLTFIFTGCSEDDSNKNDEVIEFAQKFYNKLDNIEINEDLKTERNSSFDVDLDILGTNDNKTFSDLATYWEINLGINYNDAIDLFEFLYDNKEYFETHDNQLLISDQLLTLYELNNRNNRGLFTGLTKMLGGGCKAQFAAAIADVGVAIGGTVAAAPSGIGAVIAGASVLASYVNLTNVMTNC